MKPTNTILATGYMSLSLLTGCASNAPSEYALFPQTSQQRALSLLVQARTEDALRQYYNNLPMVTLP